jgi:hypothetical protein
MMGSRGRKSIAELMIGTNGAERRPDAPYSLGDAQSEVWRTIVAAMPSGYFAPSHFPVLAQLCRHCVASDRIAALVEVVAAKKQINISELTSLHSAQSSESLAIIRLCRQLRLTHQAIYRANNTGRLTPTLEHDAPWQRKKED